MLAAAEALGCSLTSILSLYASAHDTSSAAVRDLLLLLSACRVRQADRLVLFKGSAKVAELPPYLTVQMVRFFYKVDVRQKAKILRKVRALYVRLLVVCADLCCLRAGATCCWSQQLCGVDRHSNWFHVLGLVLVVLNAVCLHT